MEIPKLMVHWRRHRVDLHEDRLVPWLLLLEADQNEEIRHALKAIAMQDPVMKKAFEEWADISHDAHSWVEYESPVRRFWTKQPSPVKRNFANRRLDYRETKKADRKNREKAAIVKSLLANGVDVDTYAKPPGFPVRKWKK